MLFMGKGTRLVFLRTAHFHRSRTEKSIPRRRPPAGVCGREQDKILHIVLREHLASISAAR